MPKIGGDTVQELNPEELSPLQREWNRGLMVQWINGHLVQRSNLDVRYSIVFYDEDRDFKYATHKLPDTATLKQLHDQFGFKYYSEGC